MKVLRKKGELSNEKKSVAYFCSYFQTWNVGEQLFLGVHKVFWHLLCKRYHQFFGTLQVGRNKHFKKYLFSGEKNVAHIAP